MVSQKLQIKDPEPFAIYEISHPSLEERNLDENNEIDECLRGMLELLKMQNAQNLIEIMQEIAKSHSGKVRSKIVKEQVEQVEEQDQNQTFVKEESDSFLSVFESCFKLKDNSS